MHNDMSGFGEAFRKKTTETSESKESEVSSVIKDTRSKLNDLQPTIFGWQKNNYVEKKERPEGELKNYVKNIIEEAVSTGKMRPLYTKDVKEALADYIILGRVNTRQNIFLESQLNELNKTSNNWKLKYILDNSQKPITELVDKIKEKIDILELLNQHKKYDTIINKYSSLHNVDSLLIKSIIYQESRFNPNARSGAGAGGLMQLTAPTARSLGVKDVYNPEQNIRGGTKYISKLIDKYSGDIPLALAAYNAGPGNVSKYGNKIPPFKETQSYVKKIMKMYNAINLV